MKYVTYVLRSTINGKLYTGHTQNLRKRLNEHNTGKTKSTKTNIPYEIVFYEVCESREEAIAREKYFKSGVGREYIKNHIINASVVQLDRISDFGSEG
jgi:putative endonuclease